MENRNRAERAKQFAPFDALKGFREALREKEQISVPRPELSAEQQERLDWLLRHILPGAALTVIWYRDGQILKETLRQAQADNKQRLLFTDEIQIPFPDILDIQMEQSIL